MIGGYYSALPAHYYQQPSKRYPAIIFIHGGGQTGNGNQDLHFVLNDGIPELLEEKLFPPNFNVNGRNYSFVILAPQFAGLPGTADVNSFISYAKNNYRIDSSRLYLSGLSMGGIVTCDVAAENPALFAAIVPISGVSWDNVNDKCKSLAAGRLPIWLFHNDGDQLINIDGPKGFISLINSFHPVIPPKFTIFPMFGLSGHDAWTKATDPLYKENNMNIYEWMLQYTR